MFADGHAEAVKRKDVVDPNNNLWRRVGTTTISRTPSIPGPVNAAQEARIDP